MTSPELRDALFRLAEVDEEAFAREDGRPCVRDGIHPAGAVAVLVLAERLGVAVDPVQLAALIEAARARLPTADESLFVDEAALAAYDREPVSLAFMASDAGTATGAVEVVQTTGGRRVCCWRDSEGRVARVTVPRTYDVPSAATARPGRRHGLVLEARRKAAMQQHGRYVPEREKMRLSAGRA